MGKIWFLDYDESKGDKKVYVHFVDKSGQSRRLLRRRSTEMYGSVECIRVLKGEEGNDRLIQVKFCGASKKFALNLAMFNYRKSKISEQFENNWVRSTEFIRCFNSLCRSGTISAAVEENVSEQNDSHTSFVLDVSTSSEIIVPQMDNSDLGDTQVNQENCASLITEGCLREEIDAAYIGFFVIEVGGLITGHQSYREIDSIRVDHLANEFFFKHNLFYQPVCVMLKDCKKSAFDEQPGDVPNKLRDDTLIVLGGQHNVSACKRALDMIKETPELAKIATAEHLRALRYRRCIVYGALSSKAQLYLSNEHQRMQQNTLDPSLQDQVKLAKALKDFPGGQCNENWQKLCNQYLHRDNEACDEQVRVIIKLASLPNDVYEELLIVFAHFEKYKLKDQKVERVLKTKPRMPWTYFRGCITTEPNDIKHVLIKLRSGSLGLKELQLAWREAKRMKTIERLICGTLQCSLPVARQKFGRELEENNLRKLFLPPAFCGADAKNLDAAIRLHLSRLVKLTVENELLEKTVDSESEFVRDSHGSSSTVCRLVTLSNLMTIKQKEWYSGFDLVVNDYRHLTDAETFRHKFINFIEQVSELNSSVAKQHYFMLVLIDEFSVSLTLETLKQRCVNYKLIFLHDPTPGFKHRSVLPYYNDLTAAALGFFGDGGQKVVPQSNLINGKSFSAICDKLVADLSSDEQTILSFVDKDCTFNRCSFSANRNLIAVVEDKNFSKMSNAMFDICLLNVDVQTTQNDSLYDFTI